MKKIFTLFILIILNLGARGQITYTVNSIPYIPESYSDGTIMGMNTDDIYSSKIPIGFDFSFFGQIYDTIVIGANGSISFDKSIANSFCGWASSGTQLPSNFSPFKNSILFPFHDLNFFTQGVIRTSIKGVAPYRKLIVSIDSCALFGCITMFATQQVILYETTNFIDINIKDKPLCAAWNGGAAHIGIEDSTTSIAYFPPNRNGTQWNASNESWRFIPSNAGPINTNNLCKIKGVVFFDLNGNCVQDAGEFGNSNQLVQTDKSGYFTYTDSIGNYELYVDTGTYVISHQPNNSIVQCPSSGAYNVSFTSLLDSISNIDFADSTKIVKDLYCGIGTYERKLCHSNLVVCKYGNKGNVLQNNVVLDITIPAGCIPTNFNKTPTSISGNLYSFNIGTLIPGQEFSLTFSDSVVCDNSFLGSLGCFTSSIHSNIVDDDSSNNLSISCYEIKNTSSSNSLLASVEHIPNGIFIDRGEFIEDEWITYKINFQNNLATNVQNAKAQLSLDSSLLDLSTLQIVAFSDSVSMILAGNFLELNFPSLNLTSIVNDEQHSHAWLLFRVKSKSNLPIHSYLLNSALVYLNYGSGNYFYTNGCMLRNYQKCLESFNNEVDICSGDSYKLPNGYVMTHVISDTLIANYVYDFNDVACDSLFNVKIHVNPTYYSNENISVCKGSSYVFPDGYLAEKINTEMVHTSILKTVHSCDSVIQTIIGLNTSDIRVKANGSKLESQSLDTKYQWYDCESKQIMINDTNKIFQTNFNSSYAVILWNGYCHDTSACYQITSNNDDVLKIYPNPASTYLVLEISTGYFSASNMNLALFDAQGKLYIQGYFIPVGKLQLDISMLAKGVYFLRLGEFVKKVLIE
jgi:hypothetical protein